MELRHLEYFLAVAAERSFTKAAARLHVVQSAVSSGLKVLEKELGATLFERSSQRVELTDAGTALLPEARAAVDAAQAAREAVAQVGQNLRGSLSIGTLTAVRLIDLPGLLGHFHRTHPGVAIRSRTAPNGSVGLIDGLLTNELDVAFLSLAGPPPPTLRHRELATVPILLALPEEHPLATKHTLTLADVAAESFVDSPVGYGNRSVVDMAFAREGLSRTVHVEVTDISTTADYVRAGLGLGFIPEFAAAGREGLRVRHIDGTEILWSLHVATAAARRVSAATAALLELVDEHVTV